MSVVLLRRIALVLIVPALGVALAFVVAGSRAQDATPDASPAASPLASPAASPASSPMGDEATVAATMTITSVDIAFDPDAMTIPADTDVVISLPNTGAAPHSFVIEELGINVQQAPGESDLSVTINAPAGTYEYICDVPGHKEAGMVGTLTVE